VSRFRAVLDAFVDVTWATKQLALQRFLDQLSPSSRHVRTDCEALRRGIDVVKLKIICCSASNADTAE
jgi:hypothetical protein